MTLTENDTGTLEHVDLQLTGMTCAACAMRIEKKLNRLDGVTATVNYATERATVAFEPALTDTAALITTVQSIGYDAALPSLTDDPDHDPALLRLADLRRRLITAIALGVPVLLLSMVSPLQFRGWQWVAVALATPVATWSAWPFHHAAWRRWCLRVSSPPTAGVCTRSSRHRRVTSAWRCQRR